MPEFLSIEALVALLTLTGLEIVLGIDNIIFIAILCDRLEPEKRARARRFGLLLAMGMRIVLLLAITAIMGLTAEFFTLFGHGFSGRDLILIGGGLFLLFKATHEIHEKIEHPDGARGEEQGLPRHAGFGAVLVQIMLLDVVFSLDSVITAVGMASQLWVMIVAIVLAVGAMLLFAGRVSAFVEEHPTLKMLALAFLLLVGVVLVADGLGQHIQKGYIYFAMAFSLGVEMLNLRAAKVTKKA